MTCKIFCDSRELRSGVPAHLERLGAELHIEIMEVGDYVLSDRVAVERKTVDDFYNSLFSDKKLFGQLHDLRQYEIPILIIEGYEAEMFTARHIDARAVEGILNSIALMRIPIRYSVNPQGTAQILASIASKEQNDEHRAVSYHGKRSHLSMSEKLVYIISAIPDVGETNAKNLLKYFGTIENISRAGISELQEVKNIGEKTAVALRNIVTENYNRS